MTSLSNHPPTLYFYIKVGVATENKMAANTWDKVMSFLKAKKYTSISLNKNPAMHARTIIGIFFILVYMLVKVPPKSGQSPCTIVQDFGQISPKMTRRELFTFIIFLDTYTCSYVV